MFNVEMYLMNTMVRTMKSDAHNSHTHIDLKRIGEESWHTHVVVEYAPNNDGEHELSDLSLSADMCAHDAPQDQRSQDVRMTNVRFNDVVHTLEVQPYSKQDEKPLN